MRLGLEGSGHLEHHILMWIPWVPGCRGCCWVLPGGRGTHDGTGLEMLG